MNGQILFDPILPWPLLWMLATLALGSSLLALWRRLPGWGLRGLAAVVLIGALVRPVWQQEDRAPLPDIVFLIEDRTASQSLGGRDAQTTETIAAMTRALEARPNTELRHVTLGDAPGDGGTHLLGALTQALAQAPRARVAGILAVTDGQVHDLDQAPVDLPAPLHVLRTGQPDDWDRRLVLRNAPAFAILGEPVTLSLRIEEEGAAPSPGGLVPLELSIDGGPPMTYPVPVGRDLPLPITLEHGGQNVLRFAIPAAPGELTDRNNAALVRINGVRDRLRVLLVSGEPHPGGRTWRNLLKSDAAVDLVHFTILRPPDKQDGVPVEELSLIAFPTRELFLEKIDDFDLIIFDRYRRRGILPGLYLDNVVRYLKDGGAVLVAAGPDFATADSLARSPLGPVLPASPTARVISESFHPALSALGQRHPVTRGLEGEHPWGRWLRQIDLTQTSGQTVMTGHQDRPLLILDRVGDGRVALLGSDHAWLWSRGYDGGGPQLDLLRRLAHWLMQEPELEEEALEAEATADGLKILRHTLGDTADPVTLTHPDGRTETVALAAEAPGRFAARVGGSGPGLYRLTDGALTRVVGFGPAAPREFERTLAAAAPLQPLVDRHQSGSSALSDGLPRLRDIRPGRPAAGRGWIGLTPRAAFETLGLRRLPVLPAGLGLVLAAMLLLLAWLRESRR